MIPVFAVWVASFKTAFPVSGGALIIVIALILQGVNLLEYREWSSKWERLTCRSLAHLFFPPSLLLRFLSYRTYEPTEGSWCPLHPCRWVKLQIGRQPLLDSVAGVNLKDQGSDFSLAFIFCLLQESYYGTLLYQPCFKKKESMSHTFLYLVKTLKKKSSSKFPSRLVHYLILSPSTSSWSKSVFKVFVLFLTFSRNLFESPSV